jgi:long-chain acyl-CoA synthetase
MTSIHGFVESRLAAFKVPVAVAFWSEALPPNAHGKILKGDLKKRTSPPTAPSDARRRADQIT